MADPMTRAATDYCVHRTNPPCIQCDSEMTKPDASEPNAYDSEGNPVRMSVGAAQPAEPRECERLAEQYAAGLAYGRHESAAEIERLRADVSDAADKIICVAKERDQLRRELEEAKALKDKAADIAIAIALAHNEHVKERDAALAEVERLKEFEFMYKELCK